MKNSDHMGKTKNSSPVVSVVVPVYNESDHIDSCVQSLLNQDYERCLMEWIFVDGGSIDDTVNKLEQYRAEYPDLFLLLNNPKKIASCALNIGIRASRGKYIVRMDAHSEYKEDYISRCLYHLEESGADNVGGVAETKAEGFVGGCIAQILSSPFGVGNSHFRTNGRKGYVDTVPYGAFHRDLFTKYGGYDERLVRNQDNEMNFRIRKNGGKILLSDDIRFSYYCRNSVKGLVDMAKQNGWWNIITMKLCPGSMSARHFIPLVFIMSIITLGIFGFFWRPLHILLTLELSLYLLLDIVFSAAISNSLKSFLLTVTLFPTFHVSYGIGSLKGLFKLLSKEYSAEAYTPPRI